MVRRCGRLTFPHMLPGGVAALIFNFIFAWNEFLFNYLIRGVNTANVPVLLTINLSRGGGAIVIILVGTAAQFSSALRWWPISRAAGDDEMSRIRVDGVSNSYRSTIALDWNSEAIQERLYPLGEIRQRVFGLSENALTESDTEATPWPFTLPEPATPRVASFSM